MTQATLIQVDLQNLFNAAKNKKQRIDFEKIWDYFSVREAEFITEAIIYMIRSADFDSSKFEAKLKSIGYAIRVKNTAKIQRNQIITHKQANQDIPMVIECLDRISTFDKWILMSGDGDFADLAKYLREKGKKVEIWSFKDCYSPALEAHADRMHFLDEEFFYSKPPIRVFGFNKDEGEEIK